MRIKQEIIEKMRSMPKIGVRLAYELNVSQSTAYRWIGENRPDGDLTRMKALQILSDELGMPIAELIIENEHATVK